MKKKLIILSFLLFDLSIIAFWTVSENLHHLGREYVRRKRFDEAEKYFEMAIKEDSCEALISLGILHYQRGNTSNARRSFEAIGRRDKRAPLFIAVLNDDFDGALDYIKRQNIHTFGEWLAGLASICKSMGKLTAAEKYYKEAIQHKAWRAYYDLGVLYRKQKRFELAEEYLQIAVEREQANLEYRMALAKTYEKQNKIDLAETHYILACHIDPISTAAPLKLGLLYLANKKFDVATKYLERFITTEKFVISLDNIESIDAEVLRAEIKKLECLKMEQWYLKDLARSFCKIKCRYEEAIKYYTMAFDIAKDDPDIFSDLGDLYREMHRNDLAEFHYKKSLDLGATFATPMIGLGLVYKHEGKLDLAEYYFKLAMQKIPTCDELVLKDLSEVYKMQGRLELAIETLERASQDGDNEASFQLGRMYLGQDKLDLAEYYFKRQLDPHLQSGPDPIHAIFNLALVYEKQKNFMLSELLYKCAAKMRHSLADRGLVRLYVSQKKYDAAMDYLKLLKKTFDPGADSLIAHVHEAMGNVGEAENHLLICAATNSSQALMDLAEFYGSHNRYDEAKRYLNYAIDKGEHKASLGLGLIYARENNIEMALHYVIQAADNGISDAFFCMAYLYEKQGMLDLAQENYKRAADLGDEVAVGKLKEYEGNLSNAEYHYKSAIENGNTTALYHLGALYQKQNKAELAESYFRRATELGVIT